MKSLRVLKNELFCYEKLSRDDGKLCYVVREGGIKKWFQNLFEMKKDVIYKVCLQKCHVNYAR